MHWHLKTKIDGLKANKRIEIEGKDRKKQSKLDEEHAQFNIHEYHEFASMVVGRHRNVTVAEGTNEENQRSQKKFKPNNNLFFLTKNGFE